VVLALGLVLFISFDFINTFVQSALIWPPIGLMLVLFSSTTFRLSAILPAAALGTPICWGKAWRVTKSDTWSFITLALVVVVGAGCLEVFVVPMFAKNLFLISLWKIVYGWDGLMVNVSILTTIYGHDVEKRPLI
jgi:hypothetical protein